MITPRMPLEATEKPVDAFQGGGSYLPSLEDTKRTSGALMAIKQEEVVWPEIKWTGWHGPEYLKVVLNEPTD